MLVVKVQRQSFDWIDTAVWSRLVWKTWKNKLEAFSCIFYNNKIFAWSLRQVTFETMWLFLISLLSTVSICDWLISFFTLWEQHPGWDLLLLTPSDVYGCCPTLSSPFPRLNSQEKLKRAVISYKLHHYSSVRVKGFHHQMTPASDDTICPRISISGQGPETPSAINTSLGSRFRWPSHELQLAPNLYAFEVSSLSSFPNF